MNRFDLATDEIQDGFQHEVGLFDITAGVIHPLGDDIGDLSTAIRSISYLDLVRLVLGVLPHTQVLRQFFGQNNRVWRLTLPTLRLTLSILC